ncbi:MAG: lipopolysaccharide kinase InaA family protein [Phycisphaerae bacterium]
MEDFADVDRVFAMQGDDMRVHKGRSVVALSIDGGTYYLKRFWWTPSQALKRFVARGFHEMRMIDWLNDQGFAGPDIVRRGQGGVFPIITKVFFLMREVPGELALEAKWRDREVDRTRLIRDLAGFAARLHDAGFVHTDFSERHILVGGPHEGDRQADFTFRLIDVERASLANRSVGRAAADIATLVASVADDELQEAVWQAFLEVYVAQRSSLPRGVDFRRLVAKAKPTKSF